MKYGRQSNSKFTQEQKELLELPTISKKDLAGSKVKVFEILKGTSKEYGDFACVFFTNAEGIQAKTYLSDLRLIEDFRNGDKLDDNLFLYTCEPVRTKSGRMYYEQYFDIQ